MNQTPTHIQKMTDLTPEQYAEAVWNGALEYCQWYCYGDELGIDSMMLTRSFWRWWRGVWEQIDKQFIAEYNHYEYLQEYKYLHRQWTNAHRIEKIVSRPGDDIVIECCKIMRAKYVKQ